MKVMVIVKASKGSEAGEMPSQQLMTEMGQYNEELVKAGILLEGAGLHPSSKGARVRFSGKERTVIDGPFAETKELIAGFWMWRVKSMAEAIEWVKRCPNPMLEDSDIEIRPLFEVEDFGEALTPELREQEAALRANILGLNMPTFQDRSSVTIAGINQSYSMATRAAIPQQWERFVPLMNSIPGKVGSTSYGVCWQTKPNCDFDYLTGVEVANTGKPFPEFTSVTLDAGRYAVFSHTDHVSAIPKTIDTIWSKWVPDCGLSIAKSPCFECYTSDFNPHTGTGGIEIWIPLQS